MRDDRRLIREYLAGSGSAFGALFDRHNPSLYAFAFRLLGQQQDAEDLCQSTWLRAIQSVGTYAARGSFRAWLHAVALSVYKNERRKRSLEVELQPDIAAADTASGTQEIVERLELAREAHRALLALEPEHREVLILHRFQGFRYREIAAMLACPVGTVKSRLHYALEALRAALQEETHVNENDEEGLRTHPAEPGRVP
jgi:RNA polymerase sigma-70 factor (ECF subfamily)